MLFNTTTFLIFLVIVFVVFWKFNKSSNTAGKMVLLAASYVFYGWWDWRFLILIIFSSATDFFLGKKIYYSEKLSSRKFLLLLSIFVNIGILFVFKYYHFFISSFQEIAGISPGKWNSLRVILPVGISFYTFQTLSYTIDIYRRKIVPTHSALTFFTFVAFFPQLVAGPIERASRLIPQFEKKMAFSYQQAVSGLKLILWGLFKKMVIADQFACIVNPVFSQPDRFSGLEIVLATFAFGFQIYCDFSGYSDIAIGTARLFGVELMANFKTPYLATSLRNFWQRWHISLSTWFRDYVYISLGGNHGNFWFWTRNIIITFAVSGLWHGANLTFLLWGFLHGAIFMAERIVSPIFRLNPKIKNVLGGIITFLLANFAWLFFRAENKEQLFFLLDKIIDQHSLSLSNLPGLIYTETGFSAQGRMLFFAFPFFIFIEIINRNKPFDAIFLNKPISFRWSFYYIIVFMILFFGVLNSAPQFIYFQF
jgi:D-alanyl-lipoteichoic acid acyltransferase DltB (MBOAT superfamily)